MAGTKENFSDVIRSTKTQGGELKAVNVKLGVPIGNNRRALTRTSSELHQHILMLLILLMEKSQSLLRNHLFRLVDPLRGPLVHKLPVNHLCLYLSYKYAMSHVNEELNFRELGNMSKGCTQSDLKMQEFGGYKGSLTDMDSKDNEL